MSVFAQTCLYLGKVVVFGQSGCVSVNVVVFWQKCLCLGKSGCSWEKWLYFGNIA